MKKTILFAILYVGLFSNFAFSQAGVAQKVPNINSKADDHSPFLSADGLTLYLSSNRFGKSHIYFSKRKDLNSPWSDPDYCKTTPNPQDFVGSMCRDDIGRYYFESSRETRVKGDMNVWEGFGLDSSATIHVLPEPLNSIKWEGHPSVTSDGNDLYFVSNRDSPAGSLEMQSDIFVAHRTKAEVWSQPQNLGSQVNIGVYNATPFISPDGRFLFFASKEKKGTDVHRKLYLCEHTGPKDIDWSKPMLLPAPINSDKDDMFPMIARDGKTMYFASNRDGGSGFDIYQVELPEKIQKLIHDSFVKK